MTIFPVATPATAMKYFAAAVIALAAAQAIIIVKNLHGMQSSFMWVALAATAVYLYFALALAVGSMRRAREFVAREMLRPLIIGGSLMVASLIYAFFAISPLQLSIQSLAFGVGLAIQTLGFALQLKHLA